MSGYSWISLTTDYGLADGFVAACHGVIARHAPAVRVLDVTHLVPAGDVRRGAAVLAQTVPALPPAVHVAVVDPGVGTARRGIAVRTEGGVLVGPDNGLLPEAAAALGGALEVVELTSPEWMAPVVSRTFHGRDIFAPVAARLALGAPLTGAGPTIDPAGLVRLPEPTLTTGAGWLAAEVLTVDHFGNVQLAASAMELERLGPAARLGQAGGEHEVVRVSAPGGEHEAVRGVTFGDAAPGGLVVHVDSAGRVAVSVNGGRAADLLGVTAGDRLRLSRPD